MQPAGFSYVDGNEAGHIREYVREILCFFCPFFLSHPNHTPLPPIPCPCLLANYSALGVSGCLSLWKFRPIFVLGRRLGAWNEGWGMLFPPNPTTFLLPGVHIYFFFLNICGSHDTKLTCKIWAPDTRYHTWPTPHPTSSHEYCPGSRSDCRINCPSKRITAFPASYALYRHFLSWPLKPDMTVVTWAHNLEWPALTTLKSHQLTQRRFEVF